MNCAALDPTPASADSLLGTDASCGAPPAPVLAAEVRRRLSPEAVVTAGEPMARRTTLGVGGPAEVYVEPAGEADLVALRRMCHHLDVPFRVFGRGSNLLVRDGGIRGVVVVLAQAGFARVEVEATRIRAGAGARLKQVALEARRAALTGLEFLEGIPGSVGGALRMNAGAHAAWTFDVLHTVRYLTPTGEIRERPAAELSARYRSCPFFADHVALEAVFGGRPAEESQIRARMDELNRRRWASQPRQPSAGCIFKNPEATPAGRLIEQLGLKGARVGGAEVSPVHANFMVNTGRATARDFLELIEQVRTRVRDATGIVLETEVEIVGED